MREDDFEKMLEAALPLAQEMLSKHGAFVPFAVSVDTEGAVAVSAVDPDEAEGDPGPEEILGMLEAGLRGQADDGAIRASAICLDVLVVQPGGEDKTDAIQTRLEHQEGDPIEVFLPYRKAALGRFRYGEVFAAGGQARVFPGAGEG